MTGKNLGAAKQHREELLYKFRLACEDLEEEVAPPGGKAPNVRKVKLKRKLLEDSYNECLRAQSVVVCLEKTSADDEPNWNWVKIHLKKYYKNAIEKTELLLETKGELEDPETEAKQQAAEEKRKAKRDMVCLEADLKDLVEGLVQAVDSTTIWLRENHSAMVESVKTTHEELTKKHLEVGENYIRYLEPKDVDSEDTRQEEFRAELGPKLGTLSAKLLSKTPAGGSAVPAVSQTRQVSQAGADQAEVQHQERHRAKFKMAAMSVPKFSGKVVDYPEWKKLFRECVEKQYQESAVVMILRNEALPDSLTNIVPRCAELTSVWEKLDRKFLDPARVWKGVKTDLKSLSRIKLGDSKYMVALVNKLLDAESLLDTVGMVHWLRQDDKIPEYEDLLSKTEKLEWVKMKPTLTGTPWENFKSFLIRMGELYEEIGKTGTAELEEESESVDGKKKCSFCKRRNHTEEECRIKKAEDGKTEGKRKCYLCGQENHLARDCPDRGKKSGQSNNKVKQVKDKKREQVDQDNFSNYLRTNDCKWCGRTYNNTFSCSGCSKQWTGKTKADHCLAHCSKYCAASAKDRGEMVIKGQNCMICLHHEHATDSCFGKDQQRTICGLDGCQRRHHPSLHSAPQSTIQAVQAANHLAEQEVGHIAPGVGGEEKFTMEAALATSALAMLGPQGKFLSRVREKRVQSHKISWSDASKTGGSEDMLEEQRAKELQDMKELLKLPAVEGYKVLLLIQNIVVKYGPRGELSEIAVFWDDGSTCSLVATATAELLGCPGEPVTVSIETVNGVITRNTKLYCVELINNSGERIIIKAFGVENVSEVRSVVNLSAVKPIFSDEVQSQWGKISKRPKGTVHLLVGQEYAGYHPVQFEARDNLVVCRSMFGQGWILTGSDDGLVAEECCWGEEVAALRVGRVTVVNQSNHRISVSQVKLTFTQERDFYTLDSLGIEPAKRCPGCKGCKECSWRGQKLSRQEAFELEYIEKCVEFKEEKFHVKFPFLVDPRELADNYHQVVKIAESEERKLAKEGRMQEFNTLFMKLQDLGALEEISEQELRSWKGAVHYVSLQHVIDEESATTSFRIVSNSSLKTPGNPHSLNSIMAKGPNMLSDPYKVLIRFRSYLRGLNSDVTKAYYQMLTGLLEKHIRRVVWRYGDKRAKWKVFGYLVVSFGDTPAAALLEVCFRIVITMFKDIDLIAAHKLLHDRFVDDITSGGDVLQVQIFKGREDPETLVCDGTMPQIMGRAKLVLKAIAVSGEPDAGALQKLGGTVLGHGYSTARDILSVKFRVNVSPRKRGMVTKPDITRETIGLLDSANLTRRVLLGVTNGQFDMLGQASPLLIKLRVSMRDLFIKESGLDWDSLLPADMRDTWVGYMKELVMAGQLEFNRCVKPEGEIDEFWLVVFFDGSSKAYAAVIYCRWQMKDGNVVVKLLCSKARVTPLLGISTPRSELSGAVVAVRLIWTVVEALELEELPTKILIGGDSETVLAAREKACGALGEYFGNRVGECWDLQEKITELVPVGIEGAGEWYHMPSKHNAADKPTRLETKPEDLAIGTEWQDGVPYLREPFSSWPWNRNFADKKVSEVVPREELTSKYRGISVGATTATLKENEIEILKKFDDGFVTNDFDKLIQMTEPLFRWFSVVMAKKMPGVITLTSKELATRFWYRVSMPATRKALTAGRLKELTIQEEQGMLVIKGRAQTGIKQLLGVEFLPVLMSSQRVAVLIMLKSHSDCDHKSVDITLATSRHHCWIVGGRKLAKTVCKFCIKCRYLRKKSETQKMAPLPRELCAPCPAFTNVGVDLAGPFKVSSMLKQRGTRRGQGTMKVWAVLAVCLNTRALKIYMAPGYSTTDFLLAWEELESDCGIPRRVHSDRGTQLVSASGAIEAVEYDWDVISASSKGQTVWSFCPSGAQWRNGAIEAQVKRFKRSLELYLKSSLNYAELQSAFKRIASVLNSRPISARYGPRHTDCDPDYLELITPNMLLTARTGVDLPMREYSDDDTPIRRLAYKQELEEAWWQQWKVQCFDSLLPTRCRWTQEQRGVKIGDVVLISYTDKSKTGTYRLGIVQQVEVDQDGLVRTCEVHYRLVRSDLPVEELRFYFKGLKFKWIRVPVQRLCVILPVEEHGIPSFLKKGDVTHDDPEEGLETDSVEKGQVEADVDSAEVTKGLIETEVTCDDIITTSGTIQELENDDKLVDVPKVLEVGDFDDVQVNDPRQVEARNLLVENYKIGITRSKKAQETSRSVKMLHRKFSNFFGRV